MAGLSLAPSDAAAPGGPQTGPSHLHNRPAILGGLLGFRSRHSHCTPPPGRSAAPQGREGGGGPPQVTLGTVSLGSGWVLRGQERRPHPTSGRGKSPGELEVTGVRGGGSLVSDTVQRGRGGSGGEQVFSPLEREGLAWEGRVPGLGPQAGLAPPKGPGAPGQKGTGHIRRTPRGPHGPYLGHKHPDGR